MDAAKPEDCTALDLRPVWRANFPSAGPAWDAALDMGIDMGQLEFNLSLTPTERLLQHEQMMRTFETLHGAALPEQR
ncbi:MAG: hypothetical protein AMXMBFR34_24470 [Myxococcaceae bacterium]